MLLPKPALIMGAKWTLLSQILRQLQVYTPLPGLMIYFFLFCFWQAMEGQNYYGTDHEKWALVKWNATEMKCYWFEHFVYKSDSVFRFLPFPTLNIDYSVTILTLTETIVVILFLTLVVFQGNIMKYRSLSYTYLLVHTTS